MFELECAYNVGAWIPVQVVSSEEAGMPEQKKTVALFACL